MPAAAYLDPPRLARTALMLALGMLAIYASAAPLGVGPKAPPSPDLLLCVIVYWSTRRPESTPMPAVFALGLVRDVLTDAPTGAGALALVLASEAVKCVRLRLARNAFTLEWLVLAGAAMGTAALTWLLVALTLMQPPYVATLFHQSIYTMMAYPFLALAFRWGFGISWHKAGTA